MPLRPNTSLRHPVHSSQLSGASLSLAMPKQVVMNTVTGMAARPGAAGVSAPQNNAGWCGRTRRTNCQRNEAHDEGVDRVVVVWKGCAGVVLQSVGIVRHDCNGCELGWQLAACAIEAAAVAHGRAVAAVRSAVQKQSHVGATVDALSVSMSQQVQKKQVHAPNAQHALWHSTSRC